MLLRREAEESNPVSVGITLTYAVALLCAFAVPATCLLLAGSQVHAFKQRAVELADDRRQQRQCESAPVLRLAAARDRLCSPGPAFYTSHGALTALRSVRHSRTRKHAMNDEI